jgi:hypothetical protein
VAKNKLLIIYLCISKPARPAPAESPRTGR